MYVTLKISKLLMKLVKYTAMEERKGERKNGPRIRWPTILVCQGLSGFPGHRLTVLKPAESWVNKVNHPGLKPQSTFLGFYSILSSNFPIR